MRSSFDNYATIKITVLWILTTVAVAFLVSLAIESHVWFPFPRLGFAVIVLIGAGSISTIFSEAPLLSLAGRYLRQDGLVQLILYSIVAFLIVAIHWKEPSSLRAIAQALGVSAFLSGAYVLVQMAGLDWGWWDPGTTSDFSFPPGGLGNSNFSGAYLGSLMPMLVYLIMTGSNIFERTFFMVGSGICLAALWFTQTRGGMTGALAGLGSMLFVYRSSFQSWLRVAFSIFAAGIVLAVVMVIWHPFLEAAPGFLKVDLLGTHSLESRFRIWTAAWHIFRDNLLTGTGLDTFYLYYPRYHLPIDGAEYGLVTVDEAHNIFLDRAATTGVLGIGAYLVLAGMALYFALRRLKIGPLENRSLLVAFLCVFVGYLAQGFFSIDVPSLAFLGWVCLGAMATLADPSVLKSQDSSRDTLVADPAERDGGVSKAQEAGPNRHLRWLLHLATVGILCGLLVVGVRPLRASMKAARHQPEVAAALYPWEAIYLDMEGVKAETFAGLTEISPKDRKRFLERAIAKYNRALDMHPGSLKFMIDLARAHSIWAELVDERHFPVAQAKWREVVAVDPSNWEIRSLYAHMLEVFAERRNDQELKLLAEAERRKVKEIRALVKE